MSGLQTGTLMAQDTASETPTMGDIQYSPYAQKDYPQRVFFGDTHHHSANSGDAFMNGDRLSPEMSYRLARGEEVISSTGVPIRLSRPIGTPA